MARKLQLYLDTIEARTYPDVIIATLRIPVSTEAKNDVLRALRSVVEPTKVQRGCLNCRLMHDSDAPGIITLWEEWASRQDIKRHMRSREYRKILAALDLADSPPEIRFTTVTESEGLDMVRDARGVSY